MKFEIDHIRFVINPGSQHRRRACMCIFKQRRNYKKKLDDLNDKLLRQYHEKAGAKRVQAGNKPISVPASSFPLGRFYWQGCFLVIV